MAGLLAADLSRHDLSKTRGAHGSEQIPWRPRCYQGYLGVGKKPRQHHHSPSAIDEAVAV